jgi:hypothetical protein
MYGQHQRRLADHGERLEELERKIYELEMMFAELCIRLWGWPAANDTDGEAPKRKERYDA